MKTSAYTKIMKLNYIRSIIFSFICQLAGWFLMTLSDFCTEKGYGNFLMFMSYFILPVVVITCYVFFGRSSGLLNSAWSEKIIDKVIWVFMAFLFAAPICTLADHNHWIIKQNEAVFFNGIEYYVFAFLFNIGCLFWFILFDIFYMVFKKKRNKKMNL